MPNIHFGTVITDASLCPRTGATGWAAWVTANINDQVKRYQKSGIHEAGSANSSDAEFIAAAYGLHLAATAGITHALLQSDNKHVINTLGTQQYTLAKRSAWPAAASALLPAFGDIQVKARWVKGHNLNGSTRAWVNDWCDKQAKMRMRVRRDEIDRTGPEDINLIE